MQNSTFWSRIFCTLEVPFFGHFRQKCPNRTSKKGTSSAGTKTETTFIIQTFPKNEDYTLRFHF